jgi:hypothetical protein
MTKYNFIADLLDTFQSSPDWIKALWLLIPPGFLLALIALLTRLRTGIRVPAGPAAGELIYSIRRDSSNLLHIISHVPATDGRLEFPLSGPAAHDSELDIGEVGAEDPGLR